MKTLNHRILVLQKVKYHLLVASRHLWLICHVMKLVFRGSHFGRIFRWTPWKHAHLTCHEEGATMKN
jgi:hypothetical protein